MEMSTHLSLSKIVSYFLVLLCLQVQGNGSHWGSLSVWEEWTLFLGMFAKGNREERERNDCLEGSFQFQFQFWRERIEGVVLRKLRFDMHNHKRRRSDQEFPPKCPTRCRFGDHFPPKTTTQRRFGDHFPPKCPIRRRFWGPHFPPICPRWNDSFCESFLVFYLFIIWTLNGLGPLKPNVHLPMLILLKNWVC